MAQPPPSPPPPADTPRPTSGPAADPLAGISLSDLEAMRLLLRGDSVIDWHQLAFRDPAEVHRFLKLNEFDLDDPIDQERLEALRQEAVEYLTRHFGYHLPAEVVAASPAEDLFLLASRRGRHQTYACIVLKVMHVMHHLDGRELLFRLPVSDDQLFGLVERKVVSVVEAIRSAGYPINEFAWSRKERDSLITKLLAKRDTIAARVYDKLRFRLVTRSRDDLVLILRELLHRLVPYNYVIPGESANNLLPFRAVLARSAQLQRLAEDLQPDSDDAADAARNEFSGGGYRCVNFVADLPLRLGHLREHLGASLAEVDDAEPQAVVFVLTEFQLVDAETSAENERGDNSHDKYKERQHIRVKARLTGQRGSR